MSDSKEAGAEDFPKIEEPANGGYVVGCPRHGVAGMTRTKQCAKCAEEEQEDIRQDRFGNKEDSYQVIADYWSSYLENGNGRLINAEDSAIMLMLFKLARYQTTGKLDHLYDMHKYAEEAYTRRSSQESE